jgi:hypothetical protein
LLPAALAFHQLHSGRSRSLVRYNDCFHGICLLRDLLVRGKLQAWKVFSISHATGYRLDAFRDDLDVELLCDVGETAARVPRSHRAANPAFL